MRDNFEISAGQTLLKQSSFFCFVLFYIFSVFVVPLALRRLRGCDVQNGELDEILQEQAETRGMRPSRPWELFADRSVRWQLITVMIISSAMQLCGNDSVRTPCVNIYQGDFHSVSPCPRRERCYVTNEDLCY